MTCHLEIRSVTSCLRRRFATGILLILHLRRGQAGNGRLDRGPSRRLVQADQAGRAAPAVQDRVVPVVQDRVVPVVQDRVVPVAQAVQAVQVRAVPGGKTGPVTGPVGQCPAKSAEAPEISWCFGVLFWNRENSLFCCGGRGCVSGILSPAGA